MRPLFSRYINCIVITFAQPSTRRCALNQPVDYFFSCSRSLYSSSPFIFISGGIPSKRDDSLEHVPPTILALYSFARVLVGTLYDMAVGSKAVYFRITIPLLRLITLG